MAKHTPGTVLDIIVFSACGRMGEAVATLANESDGFRVAGLVEKPGHPAIGRAMAAPAVVDRIPPETDPAAIVIAFPDRSGFPHLMKQLARRRLRLVCGTTGLTAEDMKTLKRYARSNAVVYDANMSVGITVLKQVLSATHAMLGSDFDAEIVESHHRNKRDAPSGTALALAREIAGADETVVGRGRRRVRERGGVHIHSVRAGGIPGDHSIVFSSEEEVLTLSHRALTRVVFARGALRAARFLASRSSGLYSMKNVLE